MPIRVSCPECKKELQAPDELIGRTVACPRCKNHFTANPNGSSTSSTGSVADALNPPDPAVASPPPAAPPPPANAGSSKSPARAASFLSGGGASASPPASPPTTATGGTTVVDPPTPPTTTPPTNSAAAPAAATPPAAPPPASPVASVPVAKPVKPVGTTTSLDPPIVPAKPKAVPRVAQAAKFIAADPNEARIQLGADGQLPQLNLSEQRQEETEVDAEGTSSPIVLALVLAGSLGMTVLMLLVDVDFGPTDSKIKADARLQIEEHYIGKPADGQEPPPDHELKDFQRVLRRALQAHNRGDRRLEKKLYRRVLNMLHSEGKGQLMGLTGMVGARTPPNDDHLEQQLSVLLK